MLLLPYVSINMFIFIIKINVKNVRDVTSMKFHRNYGARTRLYYVIFMKFSIVEIQIVHVHKSHYENKY